MRLWVLVFTYWCLASPSVADSCAAEDALAAVVRIQSDGEASGVAIGPETVVTAAHTVAPENGIRIDAGGSTFDAEIVWIDRQIDLAILKSQSPLFHTLPTHRDPVEPSAQLWSIGYPLGGVKQMREGTLLGLYNGVLLTSASVDLGDSGGAIVGCESGEAVLFGIIRGIAKGRRWPSGNNGLSGSVAIPATEIRAALRQLNN